MSLCHGVSVLRLKGDAFFEEGDADFAGVGGGTGGDDGVGHCGEDAQRGELL